MHTAAHHTEATAGTSQPFFSPATIQPKLTVGQPNDKYEQEADAMADKVMRMPQNTPAVQTKCAGCEQEEQVQPKRKRNFLSLKSMIQKMHGKEEELQTKPMLQKMDSPEEETLQTKPLMMKSEGGGGVATSALTSQLNSSKGSGSPMPASTNQYMSNAIGSDFSGVRVHTGSNAIQMNEGLNARAFTHGSDVYFNRGEYSPNSSGGKRLLGHELTHVVQQGGGDIKKKISQIPKSGINVQLSKKCPPPSYPGSSGLNHNGKKWYPHDYKGAIKSGDVKAVVSNIGYDVPNSATSNYNCMRWAIGNGVPSSREWWQGAARSASNPWPEEKFLSDKGCKKIKAKTPAKLKVKLYEYSHEDQFHIVRQEGDGNWSSKVGNSALYRGISSPDGHTAAKYEPMSKMRPSYWSCPC